jgi:hypothetical protein
MKNKSMISLQSQNMLLIFGMTAVVLLVSTSSQMQMVSASSQPNRDISCELDPEECQGIASGSSGSGTSSNSNQQAINHINQAQSALQYGDTVGAQQHMNLAKKALTPCNPGDLHC